jgi:hypothetical protein
MNTNTCENCHWWSKDPIPTVPATIEKLCNRSKFMSFGAYGQDGKAIITGPEFGCNQWEIIRTSP